VTRGDAKEVARTTRRRREGGVMGDLNGGLEGMVGEMGGRCKSPTAVGEERRKGVRRRGRRQGGEGEGWMRSVGLALARGW
jgi:hypothetical protein